MLRIKKGIKPKELEYFGFKEEKNSDICIHCFRYELEDDIYIIINNNRQILIVATHNVEYDYLEMDRYTNDLDVLYDLIQAGLVEKVSD